MINRSIVLLILILPGPLSAQPSEQFADWSILKSTFRSTGGGGITIKGYDPVITGPKCVTTFMAVTAEATPVVSPSYIEFDANAAQGGTLCTNGRWRSFDGGSSGTTPYRVFFKDGTFRGSP